LSDNVPDPTINDKQAPPYEDGWTREEVNKYPQVSTILQLPKSGYERVTIKARGIRRGQTPSPVITSEFTFQTATPNLLGNNAFHFTLTDVTSNCVVYYTTDGSKPTTNSAYFELTGGQYVGSFPSNNFPFVFFAHREGFVDSGLVSNYFSAADFVPNRITFGFDSGEASSLFLASPGQRYYAPVTLSILPGTRMYSLQFNLVVTNSGAAPTVTPRAFGFESTLVKPDTLNPGKFVGIPTAMFLDLISEPKPNPPPGERVFEYGKGWFQDLQFIDSRLNLLGVGWIERYLYDNLYNTKEQDLIKYSLPHDNLFEEDNGKVVLGGYWFQVPTNATPNQQYQIRIGLPSATADGVSVPVFIDTPTNGAIQAAKTVTLGQHKYLVGDVAPFRWFNAGEFGDSKLENNDAVQVFQSAIYGVNKPLPGSDMLDSMDSCGRTFIDRGHGYLEPSQYASNLDALFYGDDTTINQIAFGDGILDVCDVYVTFRRSLDPSLSYFRRFWTNGVRAAEFDATRPIPAGQQSLPLATRPTVTYMCGDVVANAGQTVQVPVTAKISGDFPLRVLMLKLSVQPLDGSPVLTVPVQFTPSPALGQPTQVSASGTSDYAAAWLNNQIIGLTGTATVGTLTIQIPTNAPANAAYAVHFDHASASPNGLASFGKQTVTGLITLSDRSSSSCNDSIPDSWRLRHFATLNNQLSLANADADGDGANNWQEFVAGTDPVNLESCLRLATEMKTMPQGRESVIRWPSIAGKQYVIEQSSDLFAPTWTPMSTNTGTGADMELRLPEGGTIRFYRVRVAH
ncbi:MAG TPA: chitobiase/beta-hexosaminidase C-terminal domain-containing protein, partial [Clostridia bacterium]|nr:chitobiase/beta-hexosaminidase C-terminal domain-containing protein [Clostridia bacterium]